MPELVIVKDDAGQLEGLGTLQAHGPAFGNENRDLVQVPHFARQQG